MPATQEKRNLNRPRAPIYLLPGKYLICISNPCTNQDRCRAGCSKTHSRRPVKPCCAGTLSALFNKAGKGRKGMQEVFFICRATPVKQASRLTGQAANEKAALPKTVSRFWTIPLLRVFNFAYLAASMRRLVNVRRGGPPYLPGEPLRAPISHASIRTLNGPLPLNPVHCGILIMGAATFATVFLCCRQATGPSR